MIRWTDGVRREVLPNGLTVLVQAQRSAPAAAVVTHVKAGFFDEPDRWAGVSHVLEHMFFKGTPTRGPGRIAQEIRGAGGYLNAGTSYDYTVYYVVLPASHLDTALDVQADALQRSVIDADELRRELQVIIQEAKRKRDTPGAVTGESLFAEMFDRHRIRRWRIGHEDQLARLTRDDIVGYYRSRYVPRNVVVAIAGDVDPDRAMAAACERYSGWDDVPPAVDPSPPEPPHSGVRARTLRGDVTRAHLALGWRTVPPLHPDEAALELGAAVLTAGRGAWLYRTLRAPGVVSAVSAYNFSPTELGVFGVAAELDPGRTADCLEAVGQAIERLASDGPPADDLERARSLLLSGWARQFEPMDGRASALAAAEALRDLAVLEEDYQELRQTTAAEVRDAVRRYLDPGNATAVSYLPRDAGEDLEPAWVAERLRPRAATPLAPETEPPAAVPPAVTVAATRRQEMMVVSLAGVDLILRPKNDVPTVTIGAYCAASPRETLADAGLGALALRSAIRGVNGYGAAGLATAFERRGGAVAARTGGDWLGFSATVLAEEAGAAAGLIRRVLEDPALAESEIGRERDVMVQEALRKSDDMFRYPFQLAFGAAFGDRGYGVPAGGVPESLAGFTAGEVRDRYHQLVGGRRLAMVVVGRMDPEQLAERLAGVMADYPGAARSGSSPEAEPDDLQPGVAAAACRSEERDKAQTALAVIFGGPGRRSPDRFAAEVWAAIAAGLGGRMFESLRSQRSLAYTVVASSWQRRTTGALVAYIATSPEREDEAREALFEELGVFAREPVTSAELSRAIGYLAGQRAVARQTSAAVVGEVVDAWLVGTGLDELADPGAGYRAVTAAAVAEVCRRYLGRDQRALGLVRGKPAA